MKQHRNSRHWQHWNPLSFLCSPLKVSSCLQDPSNSPNRVTHRIRLRWRWSNTIIRAGRNIGVISVSLSILIPSCGIGIPENIESSLWISMHLHQYTLSMLLIYFPWGWFCSGLLLHRHRQWHSQVDTCFGCCSHWGEAVLFQHKAWPSHQ